KENKLKQRKMHKQLNLKKPTKNQTRCTSTCFLAVITQCHIVPVHARSYSIRAKQAKSHQYSSWRTHQRNRRRRCLMKQRREKERPTEQEIGLGSQLEQLLLVGES